MRELNWQLTKFNGIHSFPADVPEGSALYSQDIANLRINRWGHLRPRPPIRHLPQEVFSDFWDDGSPEMNYWSAGGDNHWNDGLHPDEQITGVASSAEHLFYLRGDGSLFRDSVITNTLTEITGVANLSGRLSLVSAYETFVIFTSEGTDQGYYLSNNSLQALPLALDAPTAGDFQLEVGPAAAGDASLETDHLFYALTFASDNFESPPTYFSIQPRSTPQDNSYIARFRITRSAIANFDPRVTQINVYRSRELHPSTADTDAIKFYLLSTIENRTTSANPIEIERIAQGTTPIIFNDRYDHPETSGATGYEAFETINPLPDNSPMPRAIKQICSYKGRLYGTDGNVLRFSDVRYGNPHWNAWPAQNAENFEHKLEACTEYRGFLLVGGAQGLYAIGGDSPHNFVISQIARRGPVSPHAWGIVNELLTFVSINGIYMTDGAMVQAIAGELKGYFNKYAIEDGTIAQLINDASIFVVVREDDTLHFINEQGRWTRLDTDPIQQLATVPLQFGINAEAELTAVIADNRETPRFLNWIVEDDISHDNDYVGDHIDWKWESQELDWNELGIGERMKNFKWLEISGIANPSAIKITFYIDDKAPIAVTKTLDRETTDRFRPLRARINRWGYGIRFTIEGTGETTLRGLKMTIRT